MNGIRPSTTTARRALRTRTTSICLAIFAGSSLGILASFGSVGAQDMPLPPGAKQAKSGEQQESEAGKKPSGRGGVLDLVDPSRSRKRTKPKEIETDQESANAVLRMTPGLGGNPLGGLSEEVTDQLSADLKALLQITNRTGQRDALDRVSRPPHDGSGFPKISTLGVPSWTEQPTRDAMGRITNLTDANGNRLAFQYGKTGNFRGMKAEAVGHFNVDRGPGGTARPSVALGRFGRYPAGFGNPTAIDRRFTHNGAVRKLPSSPFAETTVGTLERNGGRTFATFNLLGREAYRYDSRGRLLLNQYSPAGNLMGTYDENGRLTLYGGSTAFTPGGGRVMATPQGSVLRTKDGALVNTSAPYYGMTPRTGLQGFDTNPLRINNQPKLSTPPR